MQANKVSFSLAELRPWRAAWLIAYYQALWLMCVLAALGIVEFIAAYKTSSGAFAAIGILMLVYIFLLILGRYMSVRKVFTREASEIITYAFDDQNIYLESQTSKAQMSWQRARKLLVSKYYYMIKIDKASYVILPKEKVGPELLALLTAKLRATPQA